MSRATLRIVPGLVLLAIAATSALAAGPPIQLASPPFTPFTGHSLVLADFDGANGPDLAGVDGNVVISLRNPGGTFGSQQLFPMSATTLATADLDGDGRPDLVGVSPSGFTTCLNLGGMAFTPASFAPTSSTAFNLAVGDLNGDGRPDAVTALPFIGQIAMALNDGTGNLQAAVQLPTPSDVPLPIGMIFLAIGDFTGDGKNDVLGMTDYCVRCDRFLDCCTIMVFPGRGDGAFDAPRTSEVLAACRISIAPGDLDGDHSLDIVLYAGDGISWLRNHGDGTFAPPVSLGMPVVNTYLSDGANEIAVGDLDRDGHPDIVAPAYLGRPSFQERNMFSVLINRGDGSFYPPAHYHVGRGPIDAALADLDGDGWLDGVVTTFESTEVNSTGMFGVHDAFYLRNSHFATFDAHVEVLDRVWMPVHRPVGPADLVGSANNRLTRTRNRGHGTYLAVEDLGRGAPWRAADLDGDGDDELFVTSNDSLWVLRALGGGAFGPPSSIQKGLTPRAVADVTGDGKPDLVAIDASLRVQVLAGDGGGGLAQPTDGGLTLAEMPFDRGLAAADLNGDGRADLLFFPRFCTLTSSPSYVIHTALSVAMNDGSGHFGTPDTIPGQLPVELGQQGGSPRIAVGDFDGDRVLDVVMVGEKCSLDISSWWATWRGLGGGAFAFASASFSAGNSPCSVAAADLNGDGLTDFVRTNGSGGLTFAASTFTAVGDGTFLASFSGRMEELPTDVVLADMDGDGKLDVVTHSLRTNNASIRRNVTNFDVATPTLLSLVAADLTHSAAVLDWYAAGDAPSAATIERRTDASGWSLLALLTPSGDGHLHYVDAALPSAARVGYRLRWSDADGPHVTAETWLTLPSAEFALSGAWPNPSRATPAFAIELPRAGAIDVDVFDVGGRRVAHERRVALAAGPQRVTLASTFGPGVYVARIAFAGHRLETRFVVLQ